MPGRMPLAGVRVLDLSDEAVVLAGRLLGDLGAEVIRAEALSGDRVRRRGPYLDGQFGLERSLAHLLYNAGKRSLALAIDQPEAWEMLDRLVDAVDVVIAPLEKSPPAASFFKKMRLQSAHPRAAIVDVTLRAGRAQAVTDLIGVAAGGLLYLNGFVEDPPNLPAGKLAYKQTSLAATLAAMSLVMAARRLGKGGWIEVNMQEAVSWTTLQTANENYWHWHHQRPRRSGAQGLGRPGNRSIFQCKDGLWVCVTVFPPYWDQFVAWTVEATGRRDLLAGEWKQPRYRLEHPHLIRELLDLIASQLQRDEMLRQGQEHSVLIGPVNSVADIAQDPQLLARGLLPEVWHPQFERPLTMLRPPFFSSNYDVTLKPAPSLGGDSQDILRRLLALPEAEIQTLIERGIVASGARSAPAFASQSRTRELG